MSDEEIKEVLKWLKGYEFSEIDAPNAEAIEEILQRYLSAKCPEKKEIGEMRYGGCNPDFDRGWNDCLDDYRLWLEKKLDGLEEVIVNSYCTKENSHKEVDVVLIQTIAQAIRNHLTKEE